ncbi:PREDICTED: uncharacterized protein LOC109363241 isoform X2 [Lupinus angustifolius]|uniref:uncharacterized protein LOC109363241 isoform X2 n=1 Tax=Lupinus angustifolius TaxID=3871 RepID=UPI00092ECD9A|nr:PREDICTED: uncharacterized protein LOC109363241 isoform X2 [Lupinus angustifolius]
MDLKFNHINWVGNICQKFEAVCQEVDNVVSKNAVKYLESQVQNVGGSVQKIYSGVVQDVLPLTPLVNSAKYLETQVQSVGDNVHKVYSGVVQQLLPHPPFVNSAKHEACSVAPENEIDSPVKSFAAVEDDNEKGDELTPPNNFIESLADSNAFNLANDQHAGSPIEHDLVNQVSDETCSDSYITQEEVVGDDHSIETSVDKRENMDVTIKEIAVESASQPKNSISVKEKEALEFSICSESYSGCSGSGCEVLIEKKDNLDMNLEPNSCSIVEINATNSYSSPVLNFMSPSEKESIKASLSSDLSDVADEDTHGILAEVSTAASAVPCGRPITETEPLCFKSSACSETLYSKSLGSYSYEIESYKNNSGDVAWSISDGSMESQGGLASSGHTQSVESNDESLVKSMESILDDIQLNDDTKLEESCVFVDDSELHAVSCRTQKLRSYKKRIQDAFSLKKRLVKEYEQLAIWYGDTDLEHSQGLSRTLLPFRSRTYEDSKNLQGHDASETEWELL